MLSNHEIQAKREYKIQQSSRLRRQQSAREIMKEQYEYKQQLREKQESLLSNTTSNTYPSHRDLPSSSSSLLSMPHLSYDGDELPDADKPSRTLTIENGAFVLTPDQRDIVIQSHSRTPWNRFLRFFGCSSDGSAKLESSEPQKGLFCGNALRSTRYTAWSFLPLNLFEQLAPWIKPVNFFFLCMGILQTITAISPTNGRPSILLPLTFVVAVSAIKDALEDYSRYREDLKKNKAKAFRWKNGSFVKCTSAELNVGNIIRIEDGQRIPADCLLLATGNQNGHTAWVDTQSLDGETALKPKTVPHCMLKDYRANDNGWDHWTGQVNTEAANGDLRSWAGSLKSHSSNNETVSLSSLLLADSALRNTSWACALVVYAGDDSKIRQNTRSSRGTGHLPRKETRLFAMTRKIFVVMITVQITLCFAGAIAAGILQSHALTSAWYLNASEGAGEWAVLRFFNWWIVLKDILPISLYVSLEIAQFGQILILRRDKNMSAITQGERVYAQANSSDLNEQLAHVSMVFSDKTGTLTENRMLFRKFAINDGTVFGTGTTDSGVVRELRQQKKSHWAKKLREWREHEEQRKRQRKLDEAKEKEETGKVHEQYVDFDEGDRLRSVLFESRDLPQDSPDDTFDVTRKMMYAIALNNSVYPKAKRLAPTPSSHTGMDTQHSGQSSSLSVSVGPKPPTATYDERDPDYRKDNSPDKDRESTPKLHSTPSFFHTVATAKTREENNKRSLLSKISDRWKGAFDQNAADEEVEDEQSSKLGELESSSPDEAALCAFAQQMGFELYSRAEGRVVLRIRDPGSFTSTALTRTEQTSNSDPGRLEEFEELCVFEFNSKRKRMTVILRPCDKDGKRGNHLKIYSKGADTAVRSLLPGYDCATADDSNDDRKVDDRGRHDENATLSKLQEFTDESLRSLLFAYAEKDGEWFEQYRKELDSLQQRPGRTEKGHTEGSCGSDCRLCAFETKVEKAAGLSILGVTGIEDELQEGVAHALELLLGADIRVWMLTGDSVSTAINISFACALLDADMEDEKRLFVFDREEASPERLQPAINNALEQIDRMNKQQKSGSSLHFGVALHGDVWKTVVDSAVKVQELKSSPNPYQSTSPRSFSRGNQQYSEDEKEIISSPSENSSDDYSGEDDVKSLSSLSPTKLSNILESNSNPLLSSMMKLLSQCSSVVACRLEPKEKAEIVAIMGALTKETTLAIGDASNDISMIQRADIGVAVRGREGSGAVAVSDYAIAQFSLLPRLLLTHGRNSHRRLGTLVIYIFFKSALAVGTLWMFGAVSQFSGQLLYLDWAFQLHNVLYTALPILVFAVIDFDLTDESLMKWPEIYTLTRFRHKKLTADSNAQKQNDTSIQAKLHRAKEILCGQSEHTFFSYAQFIQWTIYGFFCAFICLYWPLQSFASTTTPELGGQSYGISSTGIVVYTCVVFSTNFMLVLFIASWTHYHKVIFAFSLISYIVAICVFSTSTIFAIGGIDLYGVAFRLARIPSFYFIVLSAVSTCVLIAFAFSNVRRMFSPNSLDHYIEAERKEERSFQSAKRKYSVSSTSNSDTNIAYRSLDVHAEPIEQSEELEESFSSSSKSMHQQPPPSLERKSSSRTPRALFSYVPGIRKLMKKSSEK